MDTHVRHYVVLSDGAVLDVRDCQDARDVADENGEDVGMEGSRWWTEIAHYTTDGRYVAGGEWPCGC